MRTPARLGLIGGTGIAAWPDLEAEEPRRAQTPWGAPSAPLRLGRWRGHHLAFLLRHGDGHRIAPHAINYRANIRALHDCDVTRIIAINAVGGIAPRCAPGTLVLPEQLIDYTWGREASFHGSGEPVPHAEFAAPYSASLRAALLAAAGRSGVELLDGGCHGVTQGPRLETRAEIARLRRDGCDLVGMTGMPEAALARELGIDYACIAIVANWAAGCGDDAPITMDEVRATVAAAAAALPPLLAGMPPA